VQISGRYQLATHRLKGKSLMTSIPALSRIPTVLPPTGNLLAGRWVDDSDTTFPVLEKFTSSEIVRLQSATRAHVSEAVAGAARAAERGAPAPFERAKALRAAAELVERERGRFAELMIAEAGFTASDANGEIDRAIVTLNLCADAATRIVGAMVPFAASPGAHRRIGFTMRFPIGVVCAITPFNSPLNTVLHKVGPAYAAGNAVVLKPSALTPLTAALLAQTLLEAGVAPEFLSLVHGEGDTTGAWLLEEQAINFYTFTGSTRVGRIIQQAAGLRRTQLELGSIASTLVCADADLDSALPKIANAGFRKAGQVCTSVQRLYVHSSVADDVLERLGMAAGALPSGDPLDPATRVGPLISLAAARRTEQWLADARRAGARFVRGGTREQSVIAPTVLADVPEQQDVWCREAFAPLIAVKRFDDFEQAIADANSTPFGLAVGVFTRDLPRAMQAARLLRFGTVHINEASSSRADVMPFGGVKDSGFGHEGPDYAAREMTEERLITINP
jgi:succinate-semialdehyde dehydrogenase/glutarate-semialdehyde dehydrogenase